MIQRKFKIKDDVLLETTEVRIVDRTKLFKYNPKLRMLADDIRRSRKDEHFENYLLKAEELFAEDIEKAKVVKDPVLGNHSIFYYMYGHMNIDETIQIIRHSRDKEDAAKKKWIYWDLTRLGQSALLTIVCHN